MRDMLHAAALSSFTVKCKKGGVELSHGRAAKAGGTPHILSRTQPASLSGA